MHAGIFKCMLMWSHPGDFGTHTLVCVCVCGHVWETLVYTMPVCSHGHIWETLVHIH